jgi:MFS transporter, PPP family, 3-phenylpropionic acid transporter
MLKPKLYYFFVYGAMAALVPYLVIYYQGLGLSGSQIGLLVGIPTLMSLLSTPVWGGLADATNKKRLLLGIAILLSMTMVGVLSVTTVFLWLILVVTLYAFNAAPIIPMMDSTVMELLGEHKDHYGKLRLWGAVGWGLSAPVIGWLIKGQGIQWSFWGYLVQMAVVFIVVMNLPVAHASLGGRYWQGLRGLLQDIRWRLFLLVVFISGIGSSVLSNYLFLRLNDLGASTTLMGLALTVATISELPVFFYSGALIKRWGARPLLEFSLFVYVFRALLISILPAAGMILPVQLLHGLTFSITWAAGVSYARQIAPVGMSATAQGLFSGTFFGLGGAVGALLGGMLYQAVGSALLFRYMALVVLAAALFFLWVGRASRSPAPSSG